MKEGTADPTGDTRDEDASRTLEGAPGTPVHAPELTLNEISESMRSRLHMTADEAAKFASRHLSARAVAERDSDRIATREGRDPALQRYMDLQLGGPLSAVRCASGKSLIAAPP